MLLTSLQSQKVEEIVNHFNNGNRRVDFKAPTGSGKTLMATGVISRLINTNSDKKWIFIIATISSSDLPEQFERKINEYKGDLEFNDFDVEYIHSPSNNKAAKTPKDMQVQIKPEENKVYIFGKATFGKNRIITEQKIIDSFVQECKQQGYTICYIRDEAHIGASKLSNSDIATFEGLMDEYADFILKMTATLNLRDTSTKKVELTERDLNNPEKNDGKWLIKTTPVPLHNDNIDDGNLLDGAVDKFKEIKDDYSKLDCIIKPAMLIQVDNEPTDLDAKQVFNDTLEMIKDKLSAAGLSWVKYFGSSDKEASNVDNDNFTLDKITRNNDTTDCIIFKIGPATGWDIPRACMLLQLRNVCSTNLNIQTVGRIKRNPYPKLEQNPITDKYYLYSNQPNVRAENLSVYEYKVKDNFTNEEFASIEIKKTKDLFDKTKVKPEVLKFLEGKYSDICVRIKESFDGDVYKNMAKKIIIKSPVILLKSLKVMEDGLNAYQKQVFAVIEKEYKNTKLKDYKYQTLKIILLSHFLKDISDIVQRCIENNIKYELVMHRLDPNVYTEIVSGDTDNEKTITNNYLFNIKKNGDDTDEQYLDSKNETVVFDMIKMFSGFFSDGLKVWTKNQTTGNVYGEYLDENKYFKHSFFDFILKYNNGVLLYIEVKGEDDINSTKTELLRTAYADYFRNEKHDLFQQKIIICLAKVKGDQITPEVFYDKTLLSIPDGTTFQDLLMQAGRN
ncbi:MAG: hypothetical protein E7006_01635 [Alphaproteobacteria bacterium]|nr:hypothetical protein [Alphaproteobacteria bacterium]